MGKDYFEFLEEEFQGLTTQLQLLLAKAQEKSNNIDDGNDKDDDSSSINRSLELQLTRCQAIFQQMKAQVKGDAEYKERLALYQIQLDALNQHYHVDVRKEELVFAPHAAAVAASNKQRTNNNNNNNKWFTWVPWK